MTASVTQGSEGGSDFGKALIMHFWSRFVGATASERTNFAQTANTAAGQNATSTSLNSDVNVSSGCSTGNTAGMNNAASNRKKRRSKK